ncbi:hypothetical protein GCM10020254_85210 [Streptomyces goshikiensis]
MVRPDLLCHSHSGVEDDHQADDNGVRIVPDRDGQQCRSQQHHDQRVTQLRQHPLVERRGLRWFHFVATVPGQTTSGFGLRQSRPPPASRQGGASVVRLLMAGVTPSVR